MVYRAYSKVLVFLFLFFLVGASNASTFTVIDKLGRAVTVDIPVKRAIIVVAYELIPALNLWSQTVGVSRWAEESCDVYKAFIKSNPELKKPHVGAGSDINIETVLKLNPDIVITWTFRPDSIKFLEQKGIKVIGIYPESLNELYQVMRMKGMLFGKEEKVEEVINEMEKIFSLIKAKVSKIPLEERKKIVHLGGKPTTVSCGLAVTNDLIEIAGGVNPAGLIKKKKY